MKHLRSRTILLLILVLNAGLASRHASAQESLSLPGQFVYVESGSRLYMVRGDVEEPILLVQSAQDTTISSPRFSRDGSSLAYCLEGAEGTPPSLISLDMRTLEKHDVTRDGSCVFDWSPDGRTLVYATPAVWGRAPTEQDGIWSYSMETGEHKRLVPTAGPAIELRWSPDGKRLSYFDFCFECIGQFYTVELATGEIRQWSEENSDRYIGPDVDWSPDGQSLVFDRAISVYVPEGETVGLHLASSDGETRQEIFSLPGRGAFFPLWSPDGKRIAFASFESFTIGNYINRRGDLMTVSPDGTDPQTLYSSIYEVYPAAWSPDGRYLLFTEPLSAAGDALQKIQLGLLDAGTGDLLWTVSSFGWITADWAPIPTARAAGPADPSVQVAGKAGMLFVGSDYALAFYEPASGQVQKLTAPFSGEEFSLSPDGKTILFGDQIVTLQSQVDGTVSAAIVESPHPRDFIDLNWSPDGQRYGFVDEDGSAWVVDVTGNREQLPDGESPPDWSFDGRWMAYCDGEGRLWIAETGKPADWIVQRDRCHVEWSPTQAVLAYTTYPPLDFENRADGTTFLYDPINGRTREIAQAISGLEWSADGKLISIGRITSVGASNYVYSITIVNPDTGVELYIDEFNPEMYTNTDWIEQDDGYLFGRYRFQADLAAKEPTADILFDSTRDGSRLLVGRGDWERLEIGCQEVPANTYHPLLEVTLSDTPGAAMPGLSGQFSPDGNWVLIGDFVGEGTANWLARCEEGSAVRLPEDVWLFDHYFSPDSAWLVMEQTNSMEDGISRISLHELASGSVKDVQASLNSNSAWFQMPEAPPAPSPAPTEESLPLVQMTPTRQGGPINLQSDEPNISGRSVLAALLGWAVLLVAIVVLAYFLWKRSFLARMEQIAVPEAQTEQTEVAAVTEEPEPEPSTQAPQDVGIEYQEGVELVRAGKAEEGIRHLRNVVAAEPGNASAWFWLAIASVRQKDYRTAERCFLQAKKNGHPEADKALEWLRRQMTPPGTAA